jgi:FKBP-type peptidyl-prolyl cis-trans isomerase SlyD
MLIQEKKVVSLSYTLSVHSEAEPGEQLVEKTGKENLFTFLVGSGNVIDAFEQNLNGLKIGDSFDFTIKAEDGYGLHSEENIAAIPRQAFAPEEEPLDEEMVKVGNFLPMVDESGHQFQGLVLEINADHIVMDFNHPLAGKNLHFVGQVENVREASNDEISHGHVHGEGGVHH